MEIIRSSVLKPESPVCHWLTIFTKPYSEDLKDGNPEFKALKAQL